MKVASIADLHARALELGAKVTTDGKAFNAGGHVADVRPPRPAPAPAAVSKPEPDDDAALDARFIALEERISRQIADNAKLLTQALGAVLARNADARTPIAHDIDCKYNDDKTIRRMRVTPVFTKE